MCLYVQRIRLDYKHIYTVWFPPLYGIFLQCVNLTYISKRPRYLWANHRRKRAGVARNLWLAKFMTITDLHMRTWCASLTSAQKFCNTDDCLTVTARVFCIAVNISIFCHIWTRNQYGFSKIWSVQVWSTKLWTTSTLVCWWLILFGWRTWK